MYTIPSNGKPLTIKTCSGRVYDNGGTSNIIPNSDGSIIIAPHQNGKIVSLVLDTLDKASQDTLFIYSGSSINQSSLIGIPRSVFGQSQLYYGNSKDGSITLLYKAKENPWGNKGFSALISCVDKASAFDFTAQKMMVSKASFEKSIMLYLLIPAQKEKAPSFRINIYYSKDKVIDKNDVMGEPVFVNRLSDSPLNFNADQKIPNEVKAGEYYIIAQLDPENFITETNEGNNTIVSDLYKIE